MLEDPFHAINEHNKMIKELFNCDGSDNSKEKIKQMIVQSTYPLFLIKLLDKFTQCRPKLSEFVSVLKDCIVNAFSQQSQNIQTMIKSTIVLNAFCNGFSDNTNFVLNDINEIFEKLRNDDINGLTSRLDDIDAEYEIRNQSHDYYLFTENYLERCSITMIDFCCFYGSSQCFNFLLSNGCNITERTLKYAIAGGNQSIIDILKDKGHSFENTLKSAIQYHRYDLMFWIIEEYPNLTFPFSWSVQCLNFEGVIAMLNNGYEIELADYDNILIASCLNHYPPFIQFAVNNGANVNIRLPDRNERPIFLLCDDGEFPLLKYIVEKGANLKQIDYYYQTPLHVACKKGYLPIVQYLIEKGVNIEAKDTYRSTPLHYACQNDHLPIVQYLIEKGANIETKNDSGTPLCFACVKGHLPIVQYLIEKGANIEAKNTYFQKTPLVIACELGRFQVVQYLVEKGANIEGDSSYGTPLHYACENGYLEIVQYLIEKGAKIEAKNNRNETPLILACREKKVDVVRFLVQKGANVNPCLLSPLHVACDKGNLSIIKILVENGAHLNDGDRNGWTPLHCAVNFGNIEIVKFLLNNGANPDIKDIGNRRPCDYALNDDMKQIFLTYTPPPKQNDDDKNCYIG